MRIRSLNRWDVSPEEAIRIQRELSSLVSVRDEINTVTKVAGVDTSVHNDSMLAIVVILSYPEFTVLETARSTLPPQFPYIPGLLSFREAPSILEAFKQVQNEPDLIMVDGQGIAHPRRFGIACHIGLVLNIPTIGVAKSMLIGSHEPVGEEPGSVSYVAHGDEVIGAAVRTKAKTKPVYVSVGHRLTLETAIHYVLASIRRHRLPEPTRLAHAAAKAGVTGKAS